MAEKTIYFGAFVHSLEPTKLEICEKGAIGVDISGKISFIEREVTDVEGVKAKHGDWQDAKVVKVPGYGFFFPGFIDTHIHASQYPNAGIFGKSTLLDWLNTYTFPLEASFSELSRAAHVYNRIISRTLSHGTTTAAYYATIHVPATNLLADICKERGQRALVGRVCMDSMGPDFYRDESSEQTLAKTKECIQHIQTLDPQHEWVTPIITPRFAPACSRHCMKELGALATETGFPIQTHIAENMNEVRLVREMFPEYEGYAHVYDGAGLLTDKMILAHAVHLTPSEIELIRKREAKISHCPSSNTALTSGCTRVRKLMDKGIDIGLGTDVSGGFSASILEVARQAIWVSRFVAMSDGDEAKLSVEEVLFLATRGGAKVVGMENQIGGFEVGKDWDAQLIVLNTVDVNAITSEEHDPQVDIFGWEVWEDRVHKWVYGGDDRNTAAVWVKGRLVHSTSRMIEN